MRLGMGSSGKEVCHHLSWHCGSSKAVTLHEIAKGPVNPKHGMQLHDGGGSTIKIRVCIDAMPVFSALAIDRVKFPAEKSLLCHLLRLKELISSGALAEFRWIDTRGMIADGHTRGSIYRPLLTHVAAAWIVRTLPPKVLQCKAKSQESAATAPPAVCEYAFIVAIVDAHVDPQPLCMPRAAAHALAGTPSARCRGAWNRRRHKEHPVCGLEARAVQMGTIRIGAQRGRSTRRPALPRHRRRPWLTTPDVDDILFRLMWNARVAD